MRDDTHIFLSYSREDTEVMQRLRDDLVKEEFVVWTDENLQPGTSSWKRAIMEAIEAAGCLIVILSPNAKASKWVNEELNYAEAQQIPIFTVLASGDAATAVPLGLTDSQWVDIRSDEKYASEIKKLISAINAVGKVFRVRHYVIGVTMTVYEEGAKIDFSELTPMLDDLWVLPEYGAELFDCMVVSKELEDRQANSFWDIHFTFIQRAVRFSFTYYNQDRDLDIHINAIEWVNDYLSLGEKGISGRQAFFLPFVDQLYSIGSSQKLTPRAWVDDERIKTVSFLTLWEYQFRWESSLWEELGADFSPPEKGDEHDWKFLGRLDMNKSLPQIVDDVVNRPINPDF